MLNSLRFLAIAAASACLIYLCYTTYIIKYGGYDNLLLAAPNNQSTGGASVKDIETVNKENFMLTYETENTKSVTLELYKKSAVIKGTNFTYPFVMSYNMISGSFFTSSAQEQQSKTAVLNELAAFEFFGETNIAGHSFSIDGASYTVAGVIADRDPDNSNVYIPITLLDDVPNAYIVTLDQNGITEEYAKNELSKIGITSSGYTFYNIGQAAQMVWDRSVISVLGIGAAILFFIIKKNLSSLIKNIKILRPAYQYNSFFELFRVNTAEMFKSIMNCIMMALSAGAIIRIASAIINTLLGWDFYSGDISAYNMDAFAGKLELLQKLSYNSGYTFLAFIAFLALTVLLLAGTE